MRIKTSVVAMTIGALAGAAALSGCGATNTNSPDIKKVSDNTALPTKQTPPKNVSFRLVPSSDQLKKCMPKAKVDVSVALQTDATGRDIFKVDMSGVPAKTSFTVFLLETPATPFGAAEYIGDVNTDRYGRGHAELRLIVEEAFASTIVDKNRVRVDLNHVGMWFADATGDDFCLGKGKGPVTPFDGDNEAGVQAFNSSNSLPAAPLP
jgi:hypothetical protein